MRLTNGCARRCCRSDAAIAERAWMASAFFWTNDEAAARELWYKSELRRAILGEEGK